MDTTRQYSRCQAGLDVCFIGMGILLIHVKRTIYEQLILQNICVGVTRLVFQVFFGILSSESEQENILLSFLTVSPSLVFSVSGGGGQALLHVIRICYRNASRP